MELDIIGYGGGAAACWMAREGAPEGRPELEMVVVRLIGMRREHIRSWGGALPHGNGRAR
jgi:hypothetical protein